MPCRRELLSSAPALGREGDRWCNTFDGAGLVEANVNVIKTIHIPMVHREGRRDARDRSEILNVLNRVNLNNPISGLSSGLFGISARLSMAAPSEYVLESIRDRAEFTLYRA